MEEQSTKPERPERTRPRRSSTTAPYDRPYDDDRSAVGPTDYDSEEWAERERRRRQSWLAGPTEDEKLDWARSERRRRHRDSDYNEDPSLLGPSDEEVDAWAERERRRREEWVAGPTEDEKIDWARSERRRRRRCDDDYYYDRWDRPLSRYWDRYWGRDSDRYDRDCDREESIASRMMRDTMYAAEGAADMLINGPYRAWSRMVRNGRDWEDDDFEPRRPRRIRYRDDW
jgi:hypothetical protein